MSKEVHSANPQEYYYLPKRWYSKAHKWWILGHAARHKGKLVIISFFSIVGIFFQTAIPFIFGAVFDTALPNKSVELIVQAGALVILLGVFKLVTNFIAASGNELIAQNVEMQIRIEFYENLESKSMSFHDSSRIGDLMSMATADTRMINGSVSPGARMIVTTAFGLVITWLAMWIASPSLSIVFLLAMPFFVYFLYSYGNRLLPLSIKRQAIVAKMNAELQENLTGVRVVRTFSGQDKEIAKFSKTIDDLEDILRVRGIASAYYIPSLVIGIVTAALFLVAVYLIEVTILGPVLVPFLGIDLTLQHVSIGELITFLGLTGMLTFPTMMLRWIIDMTLLGIAGADRIFKVLTTKSQISEGTYEPKKVEGIIEFDRITFTYKEGNPEVINDVSLFINPGETLAIIGPTGCGKTTLTKLISRLYDVKSGSVKVDGVDVRDWKLNALRSNVGVIEQDTFLFSTTIRTNIAFGKKNATSEEIMAAALSAQAHEFIMSFPDGYDTIVGERGITLSGGQRQRVAMARGFLADPKILIMDDATSAVDAETEGKIQKAIKNILKGRTTIIITHRLSTLKAANKIVFIEKGKVVKVGTHEELIKTFEPYRNIFKRYLTLPPLETVVPAGVTVTEGGGS
ncbi:MAG: ABC transporter ATP-binding protein [Candidatus Hodarchaeales archaeon]|jgi:ATP-binding cassette subfamily B protein